MIWLSMSMACSPQKTDSNIEVQSAIDDFECPNLVTTDSSALAAFQKVIVFNLRYDTSFDNLNIESAAVGYNYGPNNFSTAQGYEYSLLSGDGSPIDTFTTAPPIFIYPEDQGCMLLEPSEADHNVTIGFTESDAQGFRITEQDFELVCENGSYQSSEHILIELDLQPCIDTLCSAHSVDDPWCDPD